MKFIKNIFNKLFNKEPNRLLGRWTIQYGNNMKKNIDWSNHDNSFFFEKYSIKEKYIIKL